MFSKKDCTEALGGYYVADPTAALEAGYWLVPDPVATEGVGQYLNLFDQDMYEVLFDWPKDANNKPKNGAIHK